MDLRKLNLERENYIIIILSAIHTEMFEHCVPEGNEDLEDDLPTRVCASSSTESTDADFDEPEITLKHVDDKCNGEEETKDDEFQMVMVWGNSVSLPGQFCSTKRKTQSVHNMRAQRKG
jgi:hypothetical protein